MKFREKTRKFLGSQVVHLRKLHGMTQADLAALMSVELGEDVPALTVTRIEGAKRATNVEELVAVATIFHVSLNFLVSGGAIEQAITRARALSTATERKIANIEIEIEKARAQAAAVTPLVEHIETLQLYLSTGQTHGVEDAAHALATLDIDTAQLPSWADDMRDITEQLRRTLTEHENSHLTSLPATAPPAETLELIGHIIETRPPAENKLGRGQSTSGTAPSAS